MAISKLSPPSRLDVKNAVSWLRVGSALLAAACLAALAPWLWLALQAGAGLLLVALVVLAAAALLHALPYFAQRYETWLLNARLRHAAEDPIAQLQVQLAQRSEQVQRYRAALSNMYAQIAGMHELLEARRAADPQASLSKQHSALQKMQSFHASHVQKLAAAESALADFRQHLASKRFEWRFAQAGQRALESVRPTDRDAFVHELLCEEATHAVQQDFQRIFAELDRDLTTLQLRAASDA